VRHCTGGNRSRLPATGRLAHSCRRPTEMRDDIDALMAAAHYGLDPGLSGKAVIVTGASGGIGRTIAAFFVAARANLMPAAIRAAESEALAVALNARGARAAAVAVDIADPISARHMAEATLRAFGRIDVLVCCAGIDAPRGNAWELDDAHWRAMIDADLS